MKFFKQAKLEPKMILDVGCGPMFISYALTGNFACQYIGVDIMSSSRLKKYKDAMMNLGVQTTAIRSSAGSLPLRDNVFDFVLSLDMLEHLSKPKEAVMEIHRTARNSSLVAISLPLENLFQRFSRIGFVLMKIARNPILKREKNLSVTRTPEYHYIEEIKSYDDMVAMLKDSLKLLHTEYTPLGLHRSININAVHMFKKRWPMQT